MTDPLQRGWRLVRWRPRLDGLAARVAAFLTVALLPLGLVALYQTRSVQAESEHRAGLSLLAVTAQAGAEVQQAVERALGAAGALVLARDLALDDAACAATLRRYVAERDLYAFVGFLPLDGPVTCSSAGAPLDLEDGPDVARMAADPGPAVHLNKGGPVWGRDVLVVTVPVTRGGAAAGFLALSLPRARIAPGGPPAAGAMRLVTFNGEGQVLTSRGPDPDGPPLGELLPAGLSLERAASGEARFFMGRDQGGAAHSYTIVPLVPDLVYAMGVWAPPPGSDALGGRAGAPLVFPILLWIISLAVAFWAIDRLVISPVGRLGAQMRVFGRDRTLPPPAPDGEVVHELREIADAFRQTALAIVADEARMDLAFRERGVLLREVHHRVKNNLQLISSIISMQVRRAPDPRARMILRRLQDRVLTLAAIYRSLYTSADMGDVNVAPILRAIVEQELAARPGAPTASLDIEDVVLDPDRAVPLAFLAAEAMSNAAVHAALGAAQGGEPPVIALSLRRNGATATLEIVNSLAARAGRVVEAPGLGQHLITAFAAQMGVPAQVEEGELSYRLSVTFPIDQPPDGRWEEPHTTGPPDGSWDARVSA